MRISDWSSDVCSSDLVAHRLRQADAMADRHVNRLRVGARPQHCAYRLATVGERHPRAAALHGLAVLAVETRLGDANEIGRASFRERVCQYVSLSVVAVSLTKKVYYPLKNNFLL